MNESKKSGGFARRSVLYGLAASYAGAALSPVWGRAKAQTTRIIDFRARPNTKEYLALFKESAAGLPPPETLAQFVAALDRAGVSKAVFTGRQSSIRMGSQWVDVSISNDYVAGCVGAFPDRLIGLAGANPLKRVDALHEIDRAIKELGMKGVAIDLPDVQADDRMMYPIYYRCADLNVPVVITQGPRMGNLSNPRSIAVVADDLPDLKIVCSHAIYPNVDEWIALAFRCPNVFIEASMYHFMPSSEELFAAVNTFLQDKVIYASAFPFASLDGAGIFRKQVSDENILNKVLFGNAAGVLGIS